MRLNCRGGVLLYTCSAVFGEVRKAPVMILRLLFCIVSSFLRYVCGAFSNTIEPYSKIGLMSDVYNFVNVFLSPP